MCIPFIILWRVRLATRQVICGFWILYLDLLDKSSGGITINYYPLNLTLITPLVFFCRYYPNSLSLSLRASVATNIHRYCIHFSYNFCFILAHTKPELHSLLFCTALFSVMLSLCYIAAAPTTLPLSMSRMSENVGASTSHNPMGFHGLLQGYLCLYRPQKTSSTPLLKSVYRGVA
jgi:hypothetical protein